MGASESSSEIVSTSEAVQERSEWIRAQEIKKVAIEEFLKSIEKELPEKIKTYGNMPPKYLMRKNLNISNGNSGLRDPRVSTSLLSRESLRSSKT